MWSSQTVDIKKRIAVRPTHDAEVPPVEQVAEPLRAVPLDDPLAPVQPGEVVHVLGQLADRVLQTDAAPVHDVDTVRHRVGYVLRHEAAEP